MIPYLKKAEEVVSELGSDKNLGLGEEQVLKNRERFGENSKKNSSRCLRFCSDSASVAGCRLSARI